MSPIAGFPATGPLPVPARPLPPPAVRGQVAQLLTGLFPALPRAERRHERRYPLPRLVVLHALDRDGQVDPRPPLAVVGRDLSESGLSFFHQQPISERRLLASIETADQGWLGFVIDVRWCRFIRLGWYDSGALLLGVARSPLA